MSWGAAMPPSTFTDGPLSSRVVDVSFGAVAGPLTIPSRLPSSSVKYSAEFGPTTMPAGALFAVGISSSAKKAPLVVRAPTWALAWGLGSPDAVSRYQRLPSPPTVIAPGEL
jgi:hypothetical protein